MKYQANPVIVEAHRIVSIGPEVVGVRSVELENGDIVVASAEMLARIEPKPGDYWVTQEDGYVYLNPKDVFERKYSPCVLDVDSGKYVAVHLPKRD